MPSFNNINDLLKHVSGAVTKNSGGTFTIAQLLSDDFVSSHSKFAACNDLLTHGGFTEQDLNNQDFLDGADWNAFICANTDFDSWDDMMQDAGKAIVASQLRSAGLDVR